MIKYALTFFAALAVFSSCGDSYTICDENRVVLARMDFEKNNNGVYAPYFIPSYSIRSINNLPFSIAQSNTPSVNFQLFPNADSAVYQFDTGNGLPDTIVLKYTTQNRQLSDNCGFIDYFSITSVSSTGHTIDSVHIDNALVDNQLRKNIRLLF